MVVDPGFRFKVFKGIRTVRDSGVRALWEIPAQGMQLEVNATIPNFCGPRMGGMLEMPEAVLRNVVRSQVVAGLDHALKCSAYLNAKAGLVCLRFCIESCQS